MNARSRDDIDPGILNLSFVSKWARHSLYSTPLQANIYGVLTTSYMEYSFLATMKIIIAIIIINLQLKGRSVIILYYFLL